MHPAMVASIRHRARHGSASQILVVEASMSAHARSLVAYRKSLEHRSAPGASGRHVVALPRPRQLGAFVLRVLRGFVRSGGVDLAGGVAYNGLLSMIPLCLLATAVFSRFVDRERFIEAVLRELRYVVPERTAAPITEALRALLQAPYSGGLIGMAALLFFSTLAFRTLQHALDVIFSHRLQAHPPRSLLFSALLSLAYVLALGLLTFLQTLAFAGIDKVPLLAAHLPRSMLPWLIGLALLLTSIYRFMPFGKGRLDLALIGGGCAALLWQGVQSLFVWYLENISSVNVIYGSLSAVIIVLFSFEVAAGIVLLGAQLVAELEKSRNAGLHWFEPLALVV
jgi:membrane protein